MRENCLADAKEKTYRRPRVEAVIRRATGAFLFPSLSLLRHQVAVLSILYSISTIVGRRRIMFPLSIRSKITLCFPISVHSNVTCTRRLYHVTSLPLPRGR